MPKETNGLVPTDSGQEQTYSCDEVRAVGYMLEPVKCKFCGSLEVVFLQYVDGGSGYCETCGKWQ